MTKTPRAEINRRLEEIARLIRMGFTDKEIIEQLSLKERNFYYYKAAVSRISGDIAAKKTEESLEFEADLLKDRFLRLYRNLEERITNPKTKLRGAAEAADVAMNLAVNIFRLEWEGMMTRKTRKQLQQGEGKAAKYL